MLGLVAFLVAHVLYSTAFTLANGFSAWDLLIMAVVIGVLAWEMYAWHRTQSPVGSALGLMAAMVGALLVVTGSVLVVSGKTGWFLAGLYSAAGIALIGLWLLGLNLSAQYAGPWPHRLSIFGIIAGLAMALGLAVLPGIFKGLDSWDLAPWYVNYVGQAGGWIGMLLYLVWCVLVGRWLTRR